MRDARADGFVVVEALLALRVPVSNAVVTSRRTAGAAAGAEGPEDGGAEGECHGEPSRGEHVLAHAAGDTVRLELLVESALQCGEEGR